MIWCDLKGLFCLFHRFGSFSHFYTRLLVYHLLLLRCLKSLLAFLMFDMPCEPGWLVTVNDVLSQRVWRVSGVTAWRNACRLKTRIKTSINGHRLRASLYNSHVKSSLDRLIDAMSAMYHEVPLRVLHSVVLILPLSRSRFQLPSWQIVTLTFSQYHRWVWFKKGEKWKDG